MLKDVFLKRFQELKDESDSIPFLQTRGLGSPAAPSGNWKKWATSAESLIRAVFGAESPHYMNFAKQFENCVGYQEEVQALQGIFQSAKESFEGGYIFDVELTVSGEIFGDFVVLAKEALAEGQKDVAAVLAAAALEDTLKRYAKVNGLEVDDATMKEVIGAMKSKGLVSGARKSLLDAMPQFRNSAMHAEWEKVTEPEVSSVIGFVEQFLLSEFSR